MPGGIDVLASLRRKHPSHVAELGRVSGCDLPAPRQIRLQLLQLLKPKSASNIGQAVVEAQAAPFRSAIGRALCRCRASLLIP